MTVATVVSFNERLVMDEAVIELVKRVSEGDPAQYITSYNYVRDARGGRTLTVTLIVDEKFEASMRGDNDE